MEVNMKGRIRTNLPIGIPHPPSRYSWQLISPCVGYTSQLMASPATADIPLSHNHSNKSRLGSTPAC